MKITIVPSEHPTKVSLCSLPRYLCIENTITDNALEIGDKVILITEDYAEIIFEQLLSTVSRALPLLSPQIYREFEHSIPVDGPVRLQGFGWCPEIYAEFIDDMMRGSKRKIQTWYRIRRNDQL